MYVEDSSDADSINCRATSGDDLLLCLAMSSGLLDAVRAYQNAEELLSLLRRRHPIIKHIDEHVRPPRLHACLATINHRPPCTILARQWSGLFMRESFGVLRLLGPVRYVSEVSCEGSPLVFARMI